MPNDKESFKARRLLLLRHAAKCANEDGHCTITPHCPQMKRLWGHIVHCKDKKCKFPHCTSSRYILSHYRKCRNVGCLACGPVREIIQQAKSKNLQKSGEVAEVKGDSFKNCKPPSNAFVDHLVCPITLELPIDPVIAEDGRVYERSAIEKHFETKTKSEQPLRSPYTNLPMGKRLLPSPQTKSLIESMIESGVVSEDLRDAWEKQKHEK